jgi:hypothetical protein
VNITKCLLLSKFVYLLTILNTDTAGLCTRLQKLLNNFILGETRRKWASADCIYTPKHQGGLGFIRMDSYVKPIKTTWMKRYIDGTDDAWANQLDQRFGVEQNSREIVTMMGDKKLLSCSKPEIRCLSEIIRAHAELTTKMVTDQSTKDNTWFQQPCFNNSSIKTKIMNRGRAGFKMESLEQRYFKLPLNFHCRLAELYQGFF